MADSKRYRLKTPTLALNRHRTTLTRKEAMSLSSGSCDIDEASKKSGICHLNSIVLA